MDLSPAKKAYIKEYYKQDAIVEEMVRVAEFREFAPTYPWGYGSRPDAVNFPGDFLSFVEEGAVAFHGSVEIWKNPHLIDTVDNHDNIRTGWDLVMDIDCDESMEYAKIAAVKILEALEDFGVEHHSVKFSGNRGFHIGVRREAFPDKIEGRTMAEWYPDLPQAIVDFLRNELKEELVMAFLDIDPELEGEMQQYAEEQGEDGLNPYGVCDIENNWGDRHLFRLPYSINEKSWCISLPLAKDEVMDFEKEDAEFEKFRDIDGVEERFLDEYEEDEAANLAIEALDWRARNQTPDDKEHTSFDTEFDIPMDAIDEEHFPPTIKNILDGLKDGRKRAVFILITFLVHCGYDWDSIKGMLAEWNQRNDEPLDENYIRTQLNWHRKQDEPLMPPNFDAEGFYRDLGVYAEDSLTENVNNPVSYALASANDDEEAAEESSGEDSGSGEEEEEDTSVDCPYCGKEYAGENAWYKRHVMECDG